MNFPGKQKKFWQQEAPFEPPVARTCCATRIFIRKNIKVRNRIVLTVSDFCACGVEIHSTYNSCLMLNLANQPIALQTVLGAYFIDSLLMEFCRVRLSILSMGIFIKS